MTKTPPKIVSLILVYLLRISVFLYSVTAEENQWSFIVLADWHNAEVLAYKPGDVKVTARLYDQIHHVKKTYGGELVVLPGDSNAGKWDTEEFAKKFMPRIKVKNRVLRAGRNCYGSMRAIFVEAGYEHILMAVGDHELGGNRWIPGSSKVKSLGKYRQGFAEGFNEEPETGEFLFRKDIGSAPSRPLNTPFKRTSYAHQHKNVLFITLDAFLKMPDKFFDREHGLGGEGMITCTIEGKHLYWFENVLIEARKDETIKHIIVQAHLPIIQPVRKVSCSGQFMDFGEESALWKTMVKYNVDVYLAGEVHTNTVTKDSESNLLQVISRGNSFNNFLKIDVTDNTLNITSYNEIGPKPKNNHNYEEYGNLFLNKAALCHTIGDGTPSSSPATIPNSFPSSIPSYSTKPTNLPAQSNIPSSTTKPTRLLSRLPTTIPSIEPVLAPRCTHISSSGVLEVLNRTSALVHLDFKKKILLRKRQVVGMHHDDDKEILVGRRITIRGVRSKYSLPNRGSFDQPYDAQVANVKLKYSEGHSCGVFTNRSRLAIYGTGPHSGGSIISYTLWIKTKNTSDMILVHYGHVFHGTGSKHIYTLTLQNGTPMLYISPTAILRPERKYDLNDDNWHHIAVSMLRKSCTLSEVIIYVDGVAINTTADAYDGNLFFDTSGRLSIGGFGYSHNSYEENFPHLSPFIGRLDEFYMWGRALKGDDVKLLMGI